MAPRIGYLLPTRERVMEGRPQTGPLLDLAVRAEDFGFDSVWVGDSLLARPRHDPLTLLAAVAARTKKVQLGTAVFLPALRNPTISSLSLKGWVAVETIIDEHIVRELIPQLKAAGAEGIIEYPLNKVVY